MLRKIACTFVSSRILNCEGLHTIDFMDVSHVTTHRGDNFCEKEIMVLLPGFGSVAAFFVKAVPELSSKYHILCVDWLGTGGSDRPDYTCTPGEEAEAFFVDALEKWRVAMGYDRIHICGHSIGAVLSASYAIRFPVWTPSLNHSITQSLNHSLSLSHTHTQLCHQSQFHL
jgi:pimeloyl-ACP methyl ester carboxylesterase